MYLINRTQFCFSSYKFSPQKSRGDARLIFREYIVALGGLNSENFGKNRFAKSRRKHSLQVSKRPSSVSRLPMA
eukprot:UN22792